MLKGLDPNTFRLIFFISGILCFTLWETLNPFFQKNYSKRIIHNIGFSLLNSLLIKLVFPLSLFLLAENYSHLGLNLINKLPASLTVIVSVIIMDFIIYWQHRLFHKVPLLFRLHAIHHSDSSFDFTTALRFHSIEILLSFLVKGTFVILLGIDPYSILIFEIILNFSAMFNHSNASLPSSFEKLFSKIIVTPKFHRVHHSVKSNEMNANFGFFLSLWDRIFSSERQLSLLEQREMEIGLKAGPKESFLDLLLYPFKN